MQIPHSFICPIFLLTPVKTSSTPIFVSSFRLPKLHSYVSDCEPCSVRKSNSAHSKQRFLPLPENLLLVLTPELIPDTGASSPLCQAHRPLNLVIWSWHSTSSCISSLPSWATASQEGGCHPSPAQTKAHYQPNTLAWNMTFSCIKIDALSLNRLSWCTAVNASHSNTTKIIRNLWILYFCFHNNN